MKKDTIPMIGSSTIANSIIFLTGNCFPSNSSICDWLACKIFITFFMTLVLIIRIGV